MKYSIVMLALCALGVGFTGCPRPGGENENNNDNETTTNLTAAQEQAIQKGMNEIQSLIDVFSTLNAFTDPQLALDTLTTANSFGQCPVVSYVKSATGTTALISFDFGSAGCSTLITGNQAVSGVTSTRVNVSTHVGTIDCGTLVFAGKTVLGQLAPATITAVTPGVNLAGSMSLSVAGTGQLVGTFDVTLTTTGRITINSAVFTVENGPPTQITLIGVIVDPGLSLNLVPFQGSAQFDIPSSSGTGVQPAVLTFSTETTQNGTLDVQTGGLPSFEFQVPGLV